MAKEGLRFLIPSLFISIVAFYIFVRTDFRPVLHLSVAAYLLTLFFVLFFRDPARKIPSGENLILSPADGKVKKIEVSGDGLSRVISIFMSLLDVHINRVPVDGSVGEVSYKRGRFVPAFRAKASEDNERNIVVIENEEGRVAVKQIAGMLSRRIVCRLAPGQKVKKGERFGLIHFGSLVEVALPTSADLNVRKGERVRAGETVLGVFRSE
jgi:phosphatidylserine decarboxylase